MLVLQSKYSSRENPYEPDRGLGPKMSYTEGLHLNKKSGSYNLQRNVELALCIERMYEGKVSYRGMGVCVNIGGSMEEGYRWEYFC